MVRVTDHAQKGRKTEIKPKPGKNVVRLTDHLDMTIVVWDVKQFTNKQNFKNFNHH